MRKRHPIPHILLLALLLVLTSVGLSHAGDVPLMTTDELKAMLDTPDLLILDVRRGKDWKSSEFKIKGASHYKPENYNEWVSSIPKSKKIVLYCA